MEEITRYKSYEEYKKELDGELQKTAEGFVRIGYLLKVARDTNVLAESGYKSVAEFAEAEYNLDKTQVSRFIAINDRYSEDGYSDHLLPEWQGYGYAKLTIMMQIPESIAVELSPSYSKAEIQAIKDEVDEEKKVSDLEVMMEQKETNLEDLNLIEKVLYLLLKEDWRLYEKIWNQYQKTLDEYSVKAILAPSGEKVYSVRIPGTGRVMMIMDDQKDEIQIVNTRTEDKEACTWMDLADAVHRMVDIDEAETVAESWSFLYIAPWPGEEKKQEVAPVQQTQKPEPKKEAKKESKVQKAKKTEKPQKPSTEQTPAAVAEEEQLPGQMSVEDYPELIPETSYEEVKEEQNERNNESGVPGGTGDEADHGEPVGMEENAGGEAEGIPEGDGASEGGGCEGNLASLTDTELEKYLEDTKEEMVDALNYLERHFPKHYPQYATMEQLEDMHILAIKLAAGFEKLMMWKTEWNRRPEDESNDEE